MSMSQMLPIDGEGEKAITSYLHAVDAWMAHVSTPKEDRAAVVESLREQIHDSLVAKADGSLPAVLEVMNEMPAPETFARPASGPSDAVGRAVLANAATVQQPAQRYSPNPWYSLYLCVMQILLSSVVMIVTGSYYLKWVDIYRDTGAEFPVWAKVLAPSAIFAWRYPMLTVALLAMACAPIYIVYHFLRKRTRSAVLIPLFLGGAAMAYLLVMLLGNYALLFQIPKLVGR